MDTRTQQATTMWAELRLTLLHAQQFREPAPHQVASVPMPTAPPPTPDSLTASLSSEALAGHTGKDRLDAIAQVDRANADCNTCSVNGVLSKVPHIVYEH